MVNTAIPFRTQRQFGPTERVTCQLCETYCGGLSNAQREPNYDDGMGAYRLRCPNCHFSNFFDRARTDDDGLRHRGTHASEFATRRYFNVRAFAKGHYLYTAVCRKLLPALRLDDEVDNAFAIPTAPANAFDLAFLINTQVASL